MQYALRRGLMLPLTLICATLLLSGCAGGQVIRPTPPACSSVLPDSWRVAIPPVPLPDGRTVGDWVSAFDAQTGQLEKANGRTADAIGIVERCEARDAAAVRAARPRFLGIF